MNQMKKILAALVSVLVTSITAQASFLHAPHNEANNVSCLSCHEYPFTPPYEGWVATYGYVPSASVDNTLANFICLRCHNATQSTAPKMGMHSSLAIMGKYTNWTTQCITCHDPHFQCQLYWISNPNCYLISGTITSRTYQPSPGATTLVVTGLTVTAGWENPALWYTKTGAQRGLILVANKNSPSNTYEITNATYTPANGIGTIVVSGQLTEPDGTVFGVIYGQMIKSRIIYNSGYSSVNTLVQFLTPKGGFVDPVSQIPADPPTGICQVCHTKTTRFKNTGALPVSGDTHFTYSSRDCGDCHGVQGFKAASNEASTLMIIQPDGVSDAVNVGETYNITYILADDNHDVTVAFYYDTDNTGLNGKAITGACAKAPEGLSVTCAWNTTGVTPGTYYIYGVANDMINPQVSAYSIGPITINPVMISASIPPSNDAPILSISQPGGVGVTVTVGKTVNISYSLTDADNDVTAAFYYDTDNTGLDGTAISGACAAAVEGKNVSCTWDTTGMKPGTYYVYGVSTDGINQEVSAYSTGTITINARTTPITPIDQWAIRSSGTSALFSASPGTNRLLAVAVHYEYGVNTTPIMSVTYGGKTLIKIGQSKNLRDDVWVGYLLEADIASRVGNAIAVTFSTRPISFTIASATYSNVDQTTPIQSAEVFFSPNASSSGNPAFNGLSVLGNGYSMYNITANNTITLTQPAGYAEHYDRVDSSSNFNLGAASKAIIGDGTESQTILMPSKRWGLVATSLKPTL